MSRSTPTTSKPIGNRIEECLGLFADPASPQGDKAMLRPENRVDLVALGAAVTKMIAYALPHTEYSRQNA